ncbi:MAG: PQQ-binding-like beta-propeller repeat protein, partial [Verrucomicrobiota bacterium]
MRRFLINAFLSLAFAHPLCAGDWPMFRGAPALSGEAITALPSKPSLLWKFKTGAPVKSSAIIAEGKVFIGSGDTNIYALDFATGKKLWWFKTGGTVEAPGLFAEGKVFIGSTDGFLYALNASSGKLIWKYQTDGKILGAPNLVESRGSKVQGKTSALDSRLSTLAAPATRILIGSYDYRLHCVDATTGKSNWVYETGNYINGSPAVADGKT